MKSTQAMRDRCRELSNPERDDYDRAVICIIDHLESLLRPCGECHLQPGDRCDICGKTAIVTPAAIMSEAPVQWRAFYSITYPKLWGIETTDPRAVDDGLEILVAPCMPEHAAKTLADAYNSTAASTVTPADRAGAK